MGADCVNYDNITAGQNEVMNIMTAQQRKGFTAPWVKNYMLPRKSGKKNAEDLCVFTKLWWFPQIIIS